MFFLDAEVLNCGSFMFKLLLLGRINIMKTKAFKIKKLDKATLTAQHDKAVNFINWKDGQYNGLLEEAL